MDNDPEWIDYLFPGIFVLVPVAIGVAAILGLIFVVLDVLS